MGFFIAISALVQQTVANVWRHKLRSFLTMFGIAWGIASLVLMSALCDGFRMGQRKNMRQLGDSIVLVWGGRTERQAGGQRAGRWISLYQRDVAVVREQCPLVQTVAGEVKREGFASSEFNSGRFLTLGVTPEYLQLRNLPVGTGRTIDPADVAEGRRVCVLGSSVRKQLFEERPNVLGRRVTIKGNPYQVVGLLSEKSQNSSYDGWDNDKILIPQTSLLRDCPPTESWWREGKLDTLIYRPVSVKQWKSAQQQVRATLGRIHEFDPLDESAVPMWDTLESAEMFDKAFDATEIFLAVISLITLTLGGVGVMNTMMSSVAERTSEIGLRKALGATRHRILVEFFLEGVLLAALSGAMGMAGTALLAAAVNALPMPEMFSGLPVNASSGLIALAALGTVAIASSMPPAWRAANLTPVEALREER
jgi:putative ABC transport system permease protein